MSLLCESVVLVRLLFDSDFFKLMGGQHEDVVRREKVEVHSFHRSVHVDAFDRVFLVSDVEKVDFSLAGPKHHVVVLVKFDFELRVFFRRVLRLAEFLDLVVVQIYHDFLVGGNSEDLLVVVDVQAES